MWPPPRYGQILASLQKQLRTELIEQGDPRMDGNGEVFDSYPYVDKGRDNFYERFMAGEKLKAGWVSPGDFEKEAIEEAIEERIEERIEKP